MKKILITEKQFNLIKENLRNDTGILNRTIPTYKVEMVTVESLMNAYGEDRVKKPIMVNGENWSEINISKLADDISINGFKEPIILAYDQEDMVATTIEGNHRFEVAKRLGYLEVPVKLELMTIRPDVNRIKDGMYPLQRDRIGYHPQSKVPSDLGYDGRKIQDSDFKI